MNVRSVGRIMLLVLAAAAVIMSCSYDYWLDFELGVPDLDTFTVTVPYSMTNVGSKQMYNAAINIEVSINSGMETASLWTDPVDLSYSETVTDTLEFTFVNSVIDATASVIGVRWDDSSASE